MARWNPENFGPGLTFAERVYWTFHNMPDYILDEIDKNPNLYISEFDEEGEPTTLHWVTAAYKSWKGDNCYTSEQIEIAEAKWFAINDLLAKHFGYQFHSGNE